MSQKASHTQEGNTYKTPDKGLLSRDYKELYNPIRKQTTWLKDLNRHFTQEDIKVAKNMYLLNTCLINFKLTNQ